MNINQESAAVPEWTAADRLRKARLHAGLEQTELAARIGIARSTITRYETGLAVPSRPVFLSWALATGVDLGWLAGGAAAGDVFPAGGGRIKRTTSAPPVPARPARAGFTGCGDCPHPGICAPAERCARRAARWELAA